MILNEVATVGIMISQVSPDSPEKEGKTLEAIESALELGCFDAIQTVHIQYSNERKKIKNLLNEEGKTLTYCITRMLNEKGCNLSSNELGVQQKNIEVLKRSLDEASEVGAEKIAVISGRRPVQENKRLEALDTLGEQLSKACEMAKGYEIKIVLEPLDYFAHKKNTLGTTEEAVNICKQLEEHGLELGLCIDTAHVILNNEKVSQALKIGGRYLDEFHFCNCVTDNNHELYGDNHLFFGYPGVIDENGMAAFMSELVKLGFMSEKTKLPIFCEVLNDGAQKTVELMKYCSQIMNKAWDICGGNE